MGEVLEKLDYKTSKIFHRGSKFMLFPHEWWDEVEDPDVDVQRPKFILHEVQQRTKLEVAQDDGPAFSDQPMCSYTFDDEHDSEHAGKKYSYPVEMEFAPSGKFIVGIRDPVTRIYSMLGVIVDVMESTNDP